MAKKRLVLGNWKMYLERAESAKEFVRAFKRKTAKLAGVDVGIAPPTPFIAMVCDALGSAPVRVGAQAISAEAGGYTGGVSATMARSAGADFCLIGHSERRAAGDSDEAVHSQLVAAASAGLTPVLCVGELEQLPDGAHVSFVAAQLRSALGAAQSLSAKLVVAYEPVWAIGKTSNSAMKPAEVEEMVIFIRKTLADILGRTQALRVPILYGGSVEPENAQALIAEGGINGFLVGHASADITSFFEIVNACKK